MRDLSASYACAVLVGLALITVPFWLLSGTPEVPGLVAFGCVAALAGVGLGLGVRGAARGERAGAATAIAANAVLLALATAGLWMWGRFLAEPPCPTC